MPAGSRAAAALRCQVASPAATKCTLPQPTVLRKRAPAPARPPGGSLLSTIQTGLLMFLASEARRWQSMGAHTSPSSHQKEPMCTTAACCLRRRASHSEPPLPRGDLLSPGSRRARPPVSRQHRSVHEEQLVEERARTHRQPDALQPAHGTNDLGALRDSGLLWPMVTWVRGLSRPSVGTEPCGMPCRCTDLRGVDTSFRRPQSQPSCFLLLRRNRRAA